MDELKLNVERERGARAEQILNDDLFVEAFDSVEAAFLKRWRNSEPNEADGREDIWRALKMLGEVRRVLEHHVKTGELATAQLIRDEE